jgi:hypothetical protein
VILNISNHLDKIVWLLLPAKKQPMKYFITQIVIAFTLVLLSSCVESRYTRTELYFGLSKKDGTQIPDTAWNSFLQTSVEKIFNKGFTILPAEGRWQSDSSETTCREASRIIISINRMSRPLSVRIDSLRNSYKQLFKQESVLRIDKKVSANF